MDSYAYAQGRSIVHRYLEAHGADLDSGLTALEVVDPALKDGSESFVAAGTKVIRRVDKLSNSSKGFYHLAQGRSSIREFSGDPIDLEKVNDCLRNAAKTPSVCNRQGWSVYVVTNKDKMRDLLRLQRGFKGYPVLPECVLVVVVTNNAFLSPVERNEAFVDGGLFSMSVLYGLEYEGLAAVPLNAMMNSRDERDIRNLVEVDNSEQIIMFIAVGAFKDETVVPISDRKPLSDYVSYIR
nr:nitroreductase family protein [Luteimonas sp. BDR2-5]